MQKTTIPKNHANIYGSRLEIPQELSVTAGNFPAIIHELILCVKRTIFQELHDKKIPKSFLSR